MDKTVAECAARRERARLLMTHPGVGPITALATEAILGDAARFADGKAVASYVGLIPSEFSSGGRRQRLGELTKQGSPMLRFLWCEAAGHAVRKDEQLKRFYRRKPGAEGLWQSQGRGRTQARHPAVDHAARQHQLRRVLPASTADQRCPCGDACPITWSGWIE